MCVCVCESSTTISSAQGRLARSLPACLIASFKADLLGAKRACGRCVVAADGAEDAIDLQVGATVVRKKVRVSSK